MRIEDRGQLIADDIKGSDPWDVRDVSETGGREEKQEVGSEGSNRTSIVYIYNSPARE